MYFISNADTGLSIMQQMQNEDRKNLELTSTGSAPGPELGPAAAVPRLAPGPGPPVVAV